MNEENIKVTIKKNPNGDTRTASKNVTFDFKFLSLFR